MDKPTYKKHIEDVISVEDLQTLKDARDNYGFKNQILVAVEELNELACILTKYPRYDTHDKAIDKLRDKVIDEYADVIIILRHVHSIFDLMNSEVQDRVSQKVERLRRWMQDNPSFEHTTVDRDVPGATLQQRIKKGEFHDDKKHLCNECIKLYPLCPATIEGVDLMFGSGLGEDNVWACTHFEPEIVPPVPAYPSHKEVAKKMMELCAACKEPTWVCKNCKELDNLIEELDSALSRQ